MNFNPVLGKELKVKMRNWKAAGMIALYLLVLTLVAVFIIINVMRDMSNARANREAATISYGFLSTIQFLLIVFIAPALTSGAISGERERQTLDLLLCTKLRPSAIVLGKLFSSLSQVILLIVASFPIFATVFVFGGISVTNLLQLFLFYIVVALLMGSIGIFFSTYIKRTTTSNVVTYGFVLFLLFGTLFLTAMYMQIFRRPVPPRPGVPYTPPKEQFFPLLYANPLLGFAYLMVDQFGGGGSIGLPFIRGVVPGNLQSLNPWKINMAFNFVGSCVLLTITSFRINPVRKKFSLKRKAKDTQPELESGK
jgi:ABC-2 type transport system permease protein